MQSAPAPSDEISRIATLRLLNILDTQPEERFDRLTRLAKRLFDVKIAQVTLVDTDRQWFKSSAGCSDTETSRDVSFCAHAILTDGVFVVSDATEDERFVDNPLVTGDPGIRFYAGCPLRVGTHNLGTLCVIDDKPRAFSHEEFQLLTDLGQMAEQELAALQLATTDHLTGVFNRRGFELLGRHTLSFCRRMQKPATLLYFDLDKFKWINDAHGHAAGDRALNVFAQGLIDVFRESDVIGRIGGDEFVVLLTGTGAEEVAEVLPRLDEWIAANCRVEELGYCIQFSVGQVEFDAIRHDSIGKLLEQADAAMYERKRGAAIVR